MIFRGPYPDVAIPEVSLTDFIFQSANGIQDKPALIDGSTGRAWTYAQLADSVRPTAASLAKPTTPRHSIRCWKVTETCRGLRSIRLKIWWRCHIPAAPRVCRKA